MVARFGASARSSFEEMANDRRARNPRVVMVGGEALT
jgi:hypothetical protein